MLSCLHPSQDFMGASSRWSQKCWEGWLVAGEALALAHPALSSAAHWLHDRGSSGGLSLRFLIFKSGSTCS